MKYIRTKDGIYDKEKCCIEGQVVKFFNEWFSILEQADTIEELCDCFIAVQTYQDELADYDVYYNGRAGDFRDWFSEEISEGWTIYGAIHIKNKGLIYIAKMNEKGDLELI